MYTAVFSEELKNVTHDSRCAVFSHISISFQYLTDNIIVLKVQIRQVGICQAICSTNGSKFLYPNNENTFGYLAIYDASTLL